MRSKRNLTRGLLVGAVACVAGFGVFSAAAPARLGGCICPYIYAPVKCSNGVTYTNGCFASCAGATGCVPVGPRPIPL